MDRSCVSVRSLFSDRRSCKDLGKRLLCVALPESDFHEIQLANYIMRSEFHKSKSFAAVLSQVKDEFDTLDHHTVCLMSSEARKSGVPTMIGVRSEIRERDRSISSGEGCSGIPSHNPGDSSSDSACSAKPGFGNAFKDGRFVPVNYAWPNLLEHSLENDSNLIRGRV